MWSSSNYVLLFAVFCIGQAAGAPFFYWSQPDCDQQSTDYSYNDGPSYQETMKDMFEETIRAICDIMRVTARVAKEELSEIAKIIYRHYQNTACPEESADGYPGNSVGEIYITTSEVTTAVHSLTEDRFGNTDNFSTSTGNPDNSSTSSGSTDGSSATTDNRENSSGLTKTSPSTSQSPEKEVSTTNGATSTSSILNYSTTIKLEEIEFTTSIPTTTEHSVTEMFTEGVTEIGFTSSS